MVEDEPEAVPSQDDLYDDFSNVLNKHGVTEWRGKFVTRKYAFEMREVPREAEYLKAVYSYDRKRLLNYLVATSNLYC
jgi:DNA polymerase alpha subunit A